MNVLRIVQNCQQFYVAHIFPKIFLSTQFLLCTSRKQENNFTFTIKYIKLNRVLLKNLTVAQLVTKSLPSRDHGPSFSCLLVKNLLDMLNCIKQCKTKAYLKILQQTCRALGYMHFA